jgi:hypothetical protein
VNTFRVLLSQFSDTSLALLPDRSYSANVARPYDFRLVERPEESVPALESAGR